jgi:hypothetical protein
MFSHGWRAIVLGNGATHGGRREQEEVAVGLNEALGVMLLYNKRMRKGFGK